MSQSPIPVRAAILVVEDELLIRVLAVEALAGAGFRVMEAQHGEEALGILTERAAHICAVFTDVHMPGRVDGLVLARTAAKCWPWIRLLVASGNAMPTRSELPVHCRFLPKPYEVAHVVTHLREMTCSG